MARRGVWTLPCPPHQPRSQAPALVIVHGGGWAGGSRTVDVFQKMMTDYAKRGYVTINIDYRLTGEAPFPACIEDVKCAVRWLRAHADPYHGDPERIGAYGHSAGAHLALMLAMAPKSAGLEGDGGWDEKSSLVNAVVVGSPPSELGRDVPMAKKEWWPIGYISGDHPPMFLIQGGADRIVRAELTEDFLNELASNGYVIIAIGLLDQIEERGESSCQKTDPDQLITGLDWIIAENKTTESIYFGKVDTSKVASMGMSCGGLRAIQTSPDPRITTTVVCNSGVLPVPSPMAGMPPLSKDVLKVFHGPVLYLMGGPSDIAYNNAMDDFSRVNQVPIVMTNLDVGHGGTYARPHGGANWQRVFDFGNGTERNLFLTPKSGDNTLRFAIKNGDT